MANIIQVLQIAKALNINLSVFLDKNLIGYLNVYMEINTEHLNINQGSTLVLAKLINKCNAKKVTGF